MSRQLQQRDIPLEDKKNRSKQGIWGNNFSRGAKPSFFFTGALKNKTHLVRKIKKKII